MAHEITTEELDNIHAGKYVHNWFILFEFPSGLYGFHMGSGTYNLEGQDYHGAGSVLEMEQMDSGVDLSASPILLRMRANPEAGLTVDVLASVDNEQYKNAPVSLTLVYFDPAVGEPVLVLPWWRGKVDKIPHKHVPGGEYALEATLEPVSLDHSRRGFRMRSDADQKLIDPTDRFFEHSATVMTEDLPYGRKSNNPTRGYGSGSLGAGG